VVPGIELINADFKLPAGTIRLEIPRLTGDHAVLIDTGVTNTPSRRIVPTLAANGRAITEIELVVNAHAHEDHIGGNAQMRALYPEVRGSQHG